MKPSSLIAFHRVLISSAIAFCVGFAVWTWVDGDRLLAVVFAGFAVALAVYLRNLIRILGYGRDGA